MLKGATLGPRRFFTPDPTGSAHVQTLIQISSKTDHNIQNLRFRSHPAVFPFRTRLSVCVLVSFFSPPASRPQRSQRVPRARIDGGVPTSLFQRSHMLSVHTPTLQPRRPILVPSSFPPLTYHPIPHHPLPGPLSPSRPPDSPTFLSIRSCLPLAMTSPYPTTKTPTPVHNPQFLSPITFFFLFPININTRQHTHPFFPFSFSAKLTLSLLYYWLLSIPLPPLYYLYYLPLHLCFFAYPFPDFRLIPTSSLPCSPNLPSFPLHLGKLMYPSTFLLLL